MTNQNKTRLQIISLLEQAEHTVEIAVSWLTDEIIIDKLCNIAELKSVTVLLSCDPLNVFRYQAIRELENKGAIVRKCGAATPGQGGFMHAKFMILDRKVVYGGSFNFTTAANLNFENFNKYDISSTPAFRYDFQSWMAKSIEYKSGFEDSEKLKDLILKQFKANEEFQHKLIGQIQKIHNDYPVIELSEREQLVADEISKDTLRVNVASLQSGGTRLSANGQLTQSGTGVTSKPHRFYGGKIFKTQFPGQKLPKSFHVAKTQKNELSKKFPFFKTIIQNDTLIGTAVINLPGISPYKIKLEYRFGSAPRVYILNRTITPSSDIHMYEEEALCLFYPGDMVWKESTSIAECIIPWIFEWILLYELFLLTGKWEADAVDHGPICYS